MLIDNSPHITELGFRVKVFWITKNRILKKEAVWKDMVRG